MPGNDSSLKSTLVHATYHSIEEVNDITRSSGWDGEFRQLSKGPVTSRWQALHLGPSSLISHRLDQRIHVRQLSPAGCMALLIPPSPYSLLVNGTEVGNNEVVLVRSDSEVEFVTPDEAECETLTVSRSVFEASARALFPRTHMDAEPTRVFQCDPSGWSALQREITFLLRDGGISPEDVSHLLCRFFDLMAGEPKNRLGKKSLGNGSTHCVARRAQEYIEDHYRDTTRMEDICRYTGVSLRTLQRAFLAYFQMSPAVYIKARRLNAARQALVAADSSTDQVARIAVANGCTHLGRFSVDYREHFGELPRETLARSWKGQGIGFPAETFALDSTRQNNWPAE